MARILLIEDNAELRGLLAEGLAGAGHVVLQAADGVEGLSRFRPGECDLVITDLVMPNREGIETITALRRARPGQRIIAMSGEAKNSELYLKLARRLGARCVLLKPFGVAELTRAVRAVLDADSTPPAPLRADL